MTTMLDAALEYAARGRPAFPVKQGDKKPIGRLVPSGLHNATTDPETIKRWWGLVPDANIGLRTGISFDVLDVDGDEGLKSLVHMIAEAGCCLPSAPVVETTRRGLHYYYYQPTGLGNKRGSLKSKIDFRGDGGYVVAPPSIGANGRRYEWVISPEEQALEPAPAWLVDLLTTKSSSTASNDPSTGSSSPYGQRALESELGRVVLAPEGERNDTLNRAAFAMGQLVATGELDLDEVIDKLSVAGARAGLTDAECVMTIRSGLNAGLAKPRATR